jgi:CRP/FNR family cyclic AMP-dependent transcriptional regulator
VEAVSNFHNFMNGLPEAAVYDMRACFKSRHFANREVIFHGGDPPDHVFQLASGNVALCNYSVDGQEITLNKYQPGDWFGDTGIMDGRPRINTAIALGEAELLALSRADFNNLCERHPQIQRAFSVMQANHIRLLLNLLVDASLLRLPGRVIRTIQRLLVSLGKQDADGLQYIECCHEELARYVAASRQSTSIELKKLEQAGIIRSAYGKIYVLDRQALNDRSDHLTSFEPVAALYDENDGQATEPSPTDI